MLLQGRMPDGLQRLRVESIRRGQFLKLRGDRFRHERRHLALKGQVNIGVFRRDPFGTASLQGRPPDLRMTTQDPSNPLQFAFAARRLFHP